MSKESLREELRINIQNEFKNPDRNVHDEYEDCFEECLGIYTNMFMSQHWDDFNNGKISQEEFIDNVKKEIRDNMDEIKKSTESVYADKTGIVRKDILKSKPSLADRIFDGDDVVPQEENDQAIEKEEAEEELDR